MKYLTVIGFLFLLNSPAVLGQEKVNTSDEVFTVVEDMPLFPGGEDELFNYLKKNIKYPKRARKKKIEGVVYVQFILDEKGAVTDAEVLRSPHKSLSKSALKVVKAMPNWRPGKQKGKPVRVKFILPLNYKL